MRFLRAWFLRLGGLFDKDRRDREFAAEMDSHLEFHIVDNLARGMTREEARRRAILRLGGVEQAKELYRDRRGIPALESFAQDLRFGVRALRSSTGFAAVAILTLALGIGANSAILSVGNALVLKPLPLPNLDRLVAVRESFPNQGLKATAVSPADFLDWRSQNSVFQDIAAYRVRSVTQTGAGEPELLRASFVSAAFFPALELNAAQGRTLLQEEDQPGRDRAAVMSHGLWQRRFAADPRALGTTLTLDGRSVIVVGIMPLGFDFPFGTEVWLPLALTPQQMSQRDARNLYVVAHLKPGVSQAQAQSEMLAIANRLEQQYPQTNAGLGVSVIPLRDLQSQFTRPLVLVLLGMAGFLLLIACANVANLLFARATVRYKEVAVRAALGASRWRIVRQLLAESLVLSSVAGAAGLLLANWASELIRGSLPPGIARFMLGWQQISVDGRVIAGTFAVAFVTTLVFSLAPALQISRPDLNATLKEGGRAAGMASRGRVRSLLVAAEVALALVLLTGAGLMAKGFWRILASFDSVDPNRILTLQTPLPESRYKDSQKAAAFYEQAVGRINSLPGVVNVSVASNTPLNNRPNPSVELILEARPVARPEERRPADLMVVSPHYFQTLGIPLLEGRNFDDRDGAQARAVAIVSELAARRYWQNENPLGARIKRGGSGGDQQWLTVVGVVADVKQSWFDKEIRPQLYLPYLQAPRASMTFLLRSSADPMSLAASARSQILSLDPQLPLENVRTLQQMFVEETSPFRFAAVLMLVFGGIALALSAIGVYGVMAYAVSQRTHEIGLRIALGARKSDVWRLIVGHGMKTAAIGLAVGLVLAVLLSRVLASLLFGVVALEYEVLIGFVVLLAVVAFVSCCIPTHRATKTDPIVALRCE